MTIDDGSKEAPERAWEEYARLRAGDRLDFFMIGEDTVRPFDLATVTAAAPTLTMTAEDVAWRNHRAKKGLL